MKDREKFLLVRKALRVTRKQWRALDSAGERLERRLDRMIDRKTYPSGAEWEPLITDYNNYKRLIPAIEKSLADTLETSNF